MERSVKKKTKQDQVMQTYAAGRRTDLQRSYMSEGRDKLRRSIRMQQITINFWIPLQS